MLSDKILNTELKDDESLYGGISFIGETVNDFLEDLGLDKNMSLVELNGYLNEYLNECGIKSVDLFDGENS